MVYQSHLEKALVKEASVSLHSLLIRPSVQDRFLLHIFSKFVVGSVICFAATCWGSSIGGSDSQKLINKASSTLGTVLELITWRGILQKLNNIMDNNVHPQFNMMIKQKYVQSKCSSVLLQQRTLQEVIPASNNNSTYSSITCHFGIMTVLSNSSPVQLSSS